MIFWLLDYLDLHSFFLKNQVLGLLLLRNFGSNTRCKIGVNTMELGKQIVDYANEIAQYSEAGPGVTRTFLSQEHLHAAEIIARWMETAGLVAHIDGMANVVGKYHYADNAPTLVFGSHLDSVKHGGKYDGMLGIILPIVCFQALKEQGNLPQYNIDIIAFGDEEGVRFDSSYLCSRAFSGAFQSEWLSKQDAQGISLERALLDHGTLPGDIAKIKYKTPPSAYLEVHIEQGPVLEKENLPVGIVTAINGSSRYRVTLEGLAGHAGTVPMGYRRDAGIGAAECITMIEKVASSYKETVATVGQCEFSPGAINVIPSRAQFSLDLRAPNVESMRSAYADIKKNIDQLAKKRGLVANIDTLFFSEPCACAPQIINQLATAFNLREQELFYLPSGAGHDAQAMSLITPAGMLFVRCKDGLSHHPDEDITAEDADVAANIVCEFIKNFNITGK